MGFLSAIFLGVVQGLTEFLPVSSDGHLLLGQVFVGMKEPSLFFTVAMHAGTLIAVLVYYWEDIARMLTLTPAFLGYLARGLKTKPDEAHREDDFRLMLGIVVATIPTGIIGIVFKDMFEEMATSLLAGGIGFVITGTWLLLPRIIGRNGVPKTARLEGAAPTAPNIWQAIILGVVQATAIAPGVSRSGSTVSTALMFGVEREMAARFSFLMSVPAVLGAVILKALDFRDQPPDFIVPSLVGAIVSGIVGYLAVRWLTQFIKQGAFYKFAYYVLPLGFITIALALTRG